MDGENEKSETLASRRHKFGEEGRSQWEECLPGLCVGGGRAAQRLAGLLRSPQRIFSGIRHVPLETLG